MQSNQLQRKNPNMKRITVARGGKRGKTAGRGGKGQSARAGNKRRPEWRDIIKRIPKLRGRGVNQNKPVSTKPVVVNVDILEAVFASGDAITPAILIEKGIVSTLSGRVPMIKVLGEGEITKAFTISGITVSESAEEKIKKAGGSVAPLMKGGVAVVKKVRTAPVIKEAKAEVVKEKKAPVKKAEKTEKVEKKPKTAPKK